MKENRYATDIFHRLSEEKQRKIYAAAAAEFAAHGYNAANTNAIAKRAGISVGSLFQYFKTKQALFLALVDYGTRLLLVPVIKGAKEARNPQALFRYMLVEARKFALDYPDYNKIYLGLTAQSAPPLADELAKHIEGRTVATYRRAMRKVDATHTTRNGCIAFLMDNLVLAYQFSFISEYHRARILGYTGLDPREENDTLIDALCALMAELT